MGLDPISWVAIGSLALSAGSTVMQARGARNAADTSRAVADYNARAAEIAAQQAELDSAHNTRSMRKEAATYLSRQTAAYASSGVLQDGSPLHVQASTAGRLEQQILQQQSDAKRQAENLRIEGRLGRYAGEASARADETSADIAFLTGGTRLAAQAYGMYDSGIFSSPAPGKVTGRFTGGANLNPAFGAIA